MTPAKGQIAGCGCLPSAADCATAQLKHFVPASKQGLRAGTGVARAYTVRTGGRCRSQLEEHPPSGVPPMPMRMSAAAPALATSMAAATSPSEMSLMRQPVSRHSAISSACRGRSRMTTVTSPMALPAEDCTTCEASAWQSALRWQRKGHGFASGNAAAVHHPLSPPITQVLLGRCCRQEQAKIRRSGSPPCASATAWMLLRVLRLSDTARGFTEGPTASCMSQCTGHQTWSHRSHGVGCAAPQHVQVKATQDAWHSSCRQNHLLHRHCQAAGSG